MRLRKRQRGNALVETALILPLLIGMTLVIADLYNVSQARAHLERAAHTLASTLAMHNRLDYDGVQALVNGVAPSEVFGSYQLVITRVELDRSLKWKPLHRGDEQDLCPVYSSGTTYNAELPERTLTESRDDEDKIDSAMLVVQLCRRSADLALSSNLLVDKDIQALAFARVVYNDVTLDKQLTEEIGLEDEGE